MTTGSAFPSSCWCAWPACSLPAIVTCEFCSFGTLWDRTELSCCRLKLHHTASTRSCSFFLPFPFIKGTVRTEHKDIWQIGRELELSRLQEMGKITELMFGYCLTTLMQNYLTAPQAFTYWNSPIPSCVKCCTWYRLLMGTSDTGWFVQPISGISVGCTSLWFSF